MIAGAVPVPVSATNVADPALCEIVTVAVRLPVADGLKTTEKVALPEAEIVSGNAGEVTEKSAALDPETPIEETIRSAEPGLLIVTVLAALEVLSS